MHTDNGNHESYCAPATPPETAAGTSNTTCGVTSTGPRIVTADGRFFYTFKPIPPELLTPPGSVGEICRWINETAIFPQPLLVLANTLCLWGAVVGRKVTTETDLRTNLYAIGVADSGAGKDHSRKQIKRLVAAAGLGGKLLGGEDLASDSAILKSLKQRPSQLVQMDELGHLLSSWNSRNAASYQMLIPSLLMKVFSSANTLLLGKEYATQDRIDIYEPNLCIYGTSVPDKLYTSLRPEQVEDGLLGRFPVFETGDHSPEPRGVEFSSPPVQVAQRMRAWQDRHDLPPPMSLAYEPGDLEQLDLPTFSPIVVPTSPVARSMFEHFTSQCRIHREQLRGNNGLDALWVRAPEHATKVALIIASGCGFTAGELEITEEHASFAIQLIRLLINNTCARVLRSLYENMFERNLNKVLAAIEKAAQMGCDRTALLRRFQGIRAVELGEILDRLLTTGQIHLRQKASGPQGGRPAETFVAGALEGDSSHGT